METGPAGAGGRDMPEEAGFGLDTQPQLLWYQRRRGQQGQAIREVVVAGSLSHQLGAGVG